VRELLLEAESALCTKQVSENSLIPIED
jgi:hypothetical protein